MRKLALLGAVTGSILAAGASFAQISGGHVQAGTLTCDISGGIGFLIGSQKALNCSFVPAVPGPPEFYSGVINKLGLDLGGTRVSNAIRNCPLCVTKNCPHAGFMMSVEG